MSVDLHQLANEAGFGRAKEALRKAGLWDEYAGLPEREWVVTLEIRDETRVVVKARSEDEAAKKALDDLDYEAEVLEVEPRKKPAEADDA